MSTQEATKDTYKSRLRKYKRRVDMAIWYGAGYAGAVGILGLDLLHDGPLFLRRLTLTLILIGVGLLAKARVGFEWEATCIERALEDDSTKRKTQFPNDWPRGIETCWLIAVVDLMVVAGLIIVITWYGGAENGWSAMVSFKQ